MKQYTDLKKQFSALIIFAVLAIPLAFSSAQTAQELQNKIDQKDSDIAKLEQEIASYQIELNNLEKQNIL